MPRAIAFRRHPATVVGLIALTALWLAPAGAQTAATGSPVVLYEGKLQDADRRPVGGIYPLSFALHRAAKGGKTVWSESHFVSVDAGEYIIELGRKHPIPTNVDLDRAYLGVSLTGGDEILRERLDPRSIRPGDGMPTAEAAQPAAGGARKVVDYAETAGLAFEAEHAKVADKVGELDEEAIREALRNAGGKATVGTAMRFSSLAGGEGGVQYEVMCPKGYVAVGIRGGSGLYIDSVQLICSPLE